MWTFIPHLFLRTCAAMCSLCGERKALRHNIFPIRTTRKNLTKLSDHRRRENRQNSHSKHHTHMRTSVRLTVRQVLRLLQEVLPRKITTTLQISTLTKDFKGFHRRQTSHLLLTLSVFVLFFLLFSFPLFTLSPSFFSLTFAVLSSLPLTSSLSQLLKKFSSRKALYSLTASPSSLGNSPLSLKIFSLAKFHKPFFAP